jgi:hypothetical protein
MILTTIFCWVKSVVRSLRPHMGQFKAAYRHVQKTGADRRHFRWDLDV